MITVFVAALFASLLPLLLLVLYFFTPTSRYRISQKEAGEIERLDDTPTVSLCIPARNETHALADCLQAAIASDYPKLEIIVLDDCSHDRTSEIIRSFAHNGVRFVQGNPPEADWLGKNNAYKKLSEEARGEYLIFLSVDTRIDISAVSRLIAYMQLKKISMVSVLPERRDFWRVSVLFAPLRYFWQVVLPLKFNTPLATSLWAIRTQKLDEIGGIEEVKSDITAENTLASLLFKREEYRFLIADSYLGVWYEKKWSSQMETSLRLWYPSLKKSFLYTMSVILAHFLLFLFPCLIVLYQLFTGNFMSLVTLLALTVSLFGYGLYAAYFYQTHRYGLLGGIIVFFTFPYIALQEIILIALSFYKYKRGNVDWKGRNVCYPVQPRVK